MLELLKKTRVLNFTLHTHVLNYYQEQKQMNHSFPLPPPQMNFPLALLPYSQQNTNFRNVLFVHTNILDPNLVVWVQTLYSVNNRELETNIRIPTVTCKLNVI